MGQVDAGEVKHNIGCALRIEGYHNGITTARSPFQWTLPKNGNVGSGPEECPMQECPNQLLYSHRHAWVRGVAEEEGQIVYVGLTHYYLEELSEILSIDMPMVGDELEIDHDCVHLHTAEEIEPVQSPVSGHVYEINREVLDNPDLLHMDAYEHWILAVECDDPDEFEILVDADRYVRYVESL